VAPPSPDRDTLEERILAVYGKEQRVDALHEQWLGRRAAQ
jgi:hypothetical protein